MLRRHGPALATPPASLLDTHPRSMDNPGEKYRIITDGSATTGMPAFPDLSPADRWHLVNHLLSLQQDENLEELFIPGKHRQQQS